MNTLRTVPKAWCIEVAMRGSRAVPSPFEVGEHPYRAMIFDTTLQLRVIATFAETPGVLLVEQARRLLHAFADQCEGWCIVIYDRIDNELVATLTYEVEKETHAREPSKLTRYPFPTGAEEPWRWKYHTRGT